MIIWRVRSEGKVGRDLVLERSRDCVHAESHHERIEALDLLTQVDQKLGSEHLHSGRLLIPAHILNQIAELLRICDHLLSLLLRYLQERNHDLKVEIDALSLEEIGELLLAGHEDQYFERLHDYFALVVVIKHAVQIVDVGQVDQRVDNLLEEVVCINYESILPVEKIVRFVQPEVLPDHLVEVKRLARHLINQVPQFDRVAHHRYQSR